MYACIFLSNTSVGLFLFQFHSVVNCNNYVHANTGEQVYRVTEAFVFLMFQSWLA